MSISSNFPALKPSLLLDFANVKALDPRITFTRTTTATYYDGKTTAKAEENLLLQSEDFTTTWTTQQVSVTANTTTAPDGTTTADTLKEDSTASAVHRVNQNVNSSGTVTLSVFAKLGSGTRFLTIGVNKDTVDHGSATFDLSLGTNTQTQANGGYSSASATITAVAGSFYRCTLTITTTTVQNVVIGLNDTSTPTTSNRGFGAGYTGDDTSSIIIWGAQLEQRSAVSAYTPTTTQAITNYIPVLQTAASGVARFDHNPTTGESLGLLVEEQRTNLLTYSSEFDNAAWTTNSLRVSVSANTVVAPDGTLTADKIIPNTTNDSHTIRQYSSITSGTTYTQSVYAKAGEYSFIQLITSTGFDGGGQLYRNFNLATGALGNGTLSGAIQSVGNGWYRISVTSAATSTQAGGRFNINIINADTNSANPAYAGDGYAGVFLWGAQLEVGAFPTSYIATTSATVTRNADVASMTGTNFSSWFNNAEGTVYNEFTSARPADSATAYAWDISLDGSNYIALRTAAGYNPDRIFPATVVGGVSQFSGESAAGSGYLTLPISTVKNSLAYKVNDFANCWNGGSVLTDTSGTLPTPTTLFVGANFAQNSFLNGTIKKLAFYPSRLSNAQLQALTTV